MAKIHDLLGDYIHRMNDRELLTNEWLFSEEMQLYVRKGFHILDGKRAICLDLANFEVYKKGCGTFTKLLKFAHEINPWEATYVENVLNIRLVGFLERYGMHRIGDNTAPCFYLWNKKRS